MKMYSTLLLKPRIIRLAHIWQQRQLHVIETRTKLKRILASGTLSSLAGQQKYSLEREYAIRLFGSDKESNVNKEDGEFANSGEEVDEFPQNLKHLMMYNDEDDIIKKLNACETSKQLLYVIEDKNLRINKEHMVQAVILHWVFFGRQNERDYNKKLTDKFLYLLGDHIENLNMNELCTCYLYLRKMDVDNYQTVMKDLLMNALSVVENSNEVVSLSALSRLVVAINTGRNFFTPMLCANFMRHLHHHILDCNDEDKARMIAICMMNLQPLISTEFMSLFKTKVQNLLNNGQFSKPKTIIKILNMLNMAIWSNNHVPLIKDLLLTLKPLIKQMDANELKTISRIYQYHLEPACMHEPLSESLEELLATHMSPETLACYVPFSQPNKRNTLTNAFKALLSSADSWVQPNATGYLFSTLRGLKISDSKMCNAYWNGVLREIDNASDNENHTSFLKHCHRYMNFNNNLGGTYRHIPLEKRLSQLCMRAIEHDIAGRIPQKFARLASFVFAYGHTPYSWKKYPNILLSKIITMTDQFTPMDCFLISRGLRISLEMRYRFQVPQLVNMQLATIDTILSNCAERFLNDNQLTVMDLNVLVRMLINRKSLQNSVVYHKTLQRYKEIQSQDLNSRCIKDMAYNFLATNYFVPEILENMFKYLQNNHEHILGETVEKILSCTYNLGYTPQSSEPLEYAGLILLRDFNYMSGLSLVQACLSLCYYKNIPEELINKVFCVKFIQRVEDEIQMCYSKATYPKRVLNIVMQLNRSVCLDFPEANVPWFQQNFIEAQMSKKHIVETPFSSNVKNLLTSVLKDESYFRCNHTTPYGYQKL
ncbi:FAST kinase domain-containing protein 1, mitochondrial isoform X2 [Haematobia irritans]|uniref:FAST kinase domain-containing protein 1, mitochondrial isoform X2 n=1 Tax=Haematobia irritans TaxID=7368 RepID=UPI003F500330